MFAGAAGVVVVALVLAAVAARRLPCRHRLPKVATLSSVFGCPKFF
jgi:heme A synthase